LNKADVPTRRRLVRALARLERDPFDPAMDIRPMKGHAGLWRLRIGDWRAIYEVDLFERVIDVLRLAPRGEAYR
jgi:mRNA interferase RelE/StbE